jgi:hypothetical protein
MPDLVSFDVAYNQLMQRWEDPHLTGKVTVDGGGKTRYGISQHAYPSIDIDTLTLENAKKIAYTDYWATSIWDVSLLEVVAQPLANKLFQFGFNCWVGTVVQIANLCIYVMAGHKVLPTLGTKLILAGIVPSDAQKLLFMLSSAQLSRYIKDYNMLSRVPHSLLDRALCIE